LISSELNTVPFSYQETDPTKSPEAIAKGLEMMGHKIAQLTLSNMRHQVSKEPLPVFFVDLEVK
jgi:hypothetical protein